MVWGRVIARKILLPVGLILNRKFGNILKEAEGLAISSNVKSLAVTGKFPNIIDNLMVSKT